MKKIFLVTLALIFCGVPYYNLYAQDATNSDFQYILDSGDKLRITVFNEPELSGEFEIDGSGILAFPLIGSVKAGGIDPRSLEKLLADKLRGEYLVNPRVNIEVLNFRPFFILGEVKSPGSYPYVNGLNVINAVALAGGYTPRAYKKKVLITRGQGKDRKEFHAGEEELVLPGDSIRVEERLF
jgi:polysaccharide export outer membrane protein